MNQLPLSKDARISNQPKKYKTVVIIGRFRPVQNAHMELFDLALRMGERIVITIGSAHRPRTIKNHITSKEAEQLIRKSLLEKYEEINGWADYPKEIEQRVDFIHVRDHMYNNTKWAQELYSKALLSFATSDKDTALLGCFKDDSSWYLNMFPQWELQTIKPIRAVSGIIINSTDIRNEVFKEKYLDGPMSELVPTVVYEDLCEWINSDEGDALREEFHHIQNYKAKWEHSPFPPTFNTVDAIVVKSGHVLMVKRGRNPGKGLYALPGGFLDSSERIEDAAIRELKEETKIKVDKPILRRSIKEMKVFDHPNRSLRGRTITYAHLIDLGEGPLPTVKGADDAEWAGWIPLADLYIYEDRMYEDHSDIIKFLTSRF